MPAAWSGIILQPPSFNIHGHRAILPLSAAMAVLAGRLAKRVLAVLAARLLAELVVQALLAGLAELVVQVMLAA